MRVDGRSRRGKRSGGEKPAEAPGGVRFFHIVIISLELHAIVVMLVVGSGLLDSKLPPPKNRVDIVSIKDIVPPEAKLSAQPARAQPKEEMPDTKDSSESAKAPDPTVLNAKLDEADGSFTGMSAPTSGVSSPIGAARPGKASGGGSDDNLDSYMPQYDITELPVISENDVRSRIVYPALAAKQGIEGTVYLELYINSAGRIVRVNVLKDPGFGFSDVAVRALLGMTCTPAMMEGKPVAVRFRYPVQFKLM
jgi:TonB family protein